MAGHRYMTEESTQFSNAWRYDSTHQGNPTGNLSASYWSQFADFMKRRQSANNARVSDYKAYRSSMAKNYGHNEAMSSQKATKPTLFTNASPISVPPKLMPVSSAPVKSFDPRVSARLDGTADASSWTGK